VHSSTWLTTAFAHYTHHRLQVISATGQFLAYESTVTILTSSAGYSHRVFFRHPTHLVPCYRLERFRQFCWILCYLYMSVILFLSSSSTTTTCDLLICSPLIFLIFSFLLFQPAVLFIPDHVLGHNPL